MQSNKSIDPMTKYIFHRNDQAVARFEFDPADPTCLDAVEYGYCGRVLHLLAPRIQDMDLTICVTGWTVHELPVYGPNVVSFILQDEWGREPRYRDKVRAVFKTCGTSPIRPEAFLFGDYIPNALAQTKAAMKDGTGRLRTAIAYLRQDRIAPVIDIPLGYYCDLALPARPVMERGNDLFFAGSVQHVKSFLKRPKELARQRMCDALDRLQEKNPDICVKRSITENFADSINSGNEAYLREMANTKICPIPRGANLETFRFYEAIRYGCVPVGEAFPDNGFYKDAPIIRLDHWSQLGEVIPPLLKDGDRLEELSARALKWWQDRCSEQATALLIERHLRQLQPSAR